MTMPSMTPRLRRCQAKVNPPCQRLIAWSGRGRPLCSEHKDK